MKKKQAKKQVRLRMVPMLERGSDIHKSFREILERRAQESEAVRQQRVSETADLVLDAVDAKIDAFVKEGIQPPRKMRPDEYSKWLFRKFSRVYDLKSIIEIPGIKERKEVLIKGRMSRAVSKYSERLYNQGILVQRPLLPVKEESPFIIPERRTAAITKQKKRPGVNLAIEAEKIRPFIKVPSDKQFYDAKEEMVRDIKDKIRTGDIRIQNLSETDGLGRDMVIEGLAKHIYDLETWARQRRR